MYCCRTQVLQADIIWNQCANLPTDLAEGQSVVVNDKVYCGGSAASENEYLVYHYDPSQDKWTTLSPLSVRYFGLGEVNGELMAIGGVKKGADRPTNEVLTYDPRLQRWKQAFTPMPTSRAFPSILSLQLVLVVAGGLIELYDDDYTTAVEIFQKDTSQWHKTDPLPTVSHYMSTVAIGNTCYALGEYRLPDNNQILYASVDDLFRNAVPGTQTVNTDGSDTQSAWKILPNTPTYQPAAAVLASNLLAVGGWKSSKAGARKQEVYMYSSSMNSWVYISDLPAPRASTAVAALSRSEILVIGGSGGDDNSVCTVYKGTLNIKV